MNASSNIAKVESRGKIYFNYEKSNSRIIWFYGIFPNIFKTGIRKSHDATGALKHPSTGQKTLFPKAEKCNIYCRLKI